MPVKCCMRAPAAHSYSELTDVFRSLRIHENMFHPTNQDLWQIDGRKLGTIGACRMLPAAALTYIASSLITLNTASLLAQFIEADTCMVKQLQITNPVQMNFAVGSSRPNWKTIATPSSSSYDSNDVEIVEGESGVWVVSRKGVSLSAERKVWDNRNRELHNRHSTLET
ncbi:hypothetical protein P152DRAFT_189556 [Eremomyces bilateralis CBS 781.70]|uniref:Uncharacterized protein n=1 Tax=Eremomyces bilateralis CBS 781.70 TaxID=1392243 RepID=A0A6G1GC00_9PEZI|nr:uncharacterized protein P152DRAFT_189556 [Eremomyces bilateralis CBS 781.70]KAF1815573.1 hypothetical protein P152DRAFT_189556 [Eremomyces bilateralis CBS 781.70]